MVFDIFIRMKTNRAKYIECPIAPVIEQPLHGTHGWRWGNKPNDSSRCVRFVATLLPIFPWGNFKIKEILGIPQTPRKGRCPLRISGYAGISYSSFIVKDHNRLKCAVYIRNFRVFNQVIAIYCPML